MEQRTCSVSECPRPYKRAGYCYGHYMKNWRYGTPTPQRDPGWVDIRGHRYGTLVVVDRTPDGWLCDCDCGRTRTVSAGDLNRSGEASTCGHRQTHRRQEACGYGAAHDRVRRDRGSIHRQWCIDCGEAAQHWSYNHDDPDELYAEDLSAHGVAYSPQPRHYSPRCVRCHKRFDLARLASTPAAILNFAD